MRLCSDVMVILLGLSLMGCGGSSSNSTGDGGGGGQKPNKAPYVNWETIPAEYNPKTKDIPFNTESIERIHINASGFSKDVEVVYSNQVKSHEGLLRVYRVWKEKASWGDLSPRRNGKNLDLKTQGSYSCSIQIKNGQIAYLKGGCYVRIELFLPVGAEIEVYNVGQLLTKRFIPMDNESFLNELDSVFRSEDKFNIIENYLASYTGGRHPTLISKELGEVIHGFIRKEDKFKVLKRLHPIVSDRQNLKVMIDDEFNYFDREEAYQIVGV